MCPQCCKAPCSFIQIDHCKCSPPVHQAENDDGQGNDEHDHPKTDGNQLLCLGRTASVITDEEAAFPTIIGRAAADQKSAYQR